MSFESRFLKLKTKTWARDSYGLFDYETKNYFAHNFEIRNPGYLIREGNEILFIDESTPDIQKKLASSKTAEQLAFVTEENGKALLAIFISKCYYHFRRDCCQIRFKFQ